MHPAPNTALGVTLNVLASFLFAAMFSYTSLLSAMAGTELYGWRMLLTLPCLTLFMWLQGHWSLVTHLWQRLKQERWFWLTRLLSAVLLGVQLWLFLWAPANQYALAVSLGYFMMPIAMVVVGFVGFGERLSGMQKLACLLAVAGVANQLSLPGALAWPTLVICFGYPLYFWLRRKTDSNHIGALWFDMLFSLPVALLFIWQGGYVAETLFQNHILLWQIAGLGLISAMALALQSLSAPHLNLSLFGLLAYVEPVLLLIVALLLGEEIQSGEWPTFIGIWLSLLVLMAEGWKNRPRRRV